MKPASVKQIKIALEHAPQKELLEICLRLSKFKKENKELISYLLFEAGDEAGYVKAVKETLEEIFEDVNVKTIYFAKKTIRKIVRTANKYIRYSNVETTEPDILLFICEKIKALDLDLQKNTALFNLYQSLIKRIDKAISTMHEDNQYDYLKSLEQLRIEEKTGFSLFRKQKK